eukprot:COSAG06_NODE_19490_length_835_cov_39.987772_2_plen_31_part_01
MEDTLRDMSCRRSRPSSWRRDWSANHVLTMS